MNEKYDAWCQSVPVETLQRWFMEGRLAEKAFEAGRASMKGEVVAILADHPFPKKDPWEAVTSVEP